MSLAFDNALERAQHALSDAKQSLQFLLETDKIQMEKILWGSFLMAIDSVRQALIDKEFKGKKEHNDWYSKFSYEMKNDQLLVYMRNARNNFQHTVTKAPVINPALFKIKDKNGKGFPMDSISTSFKDGCLKISLESKNLPDDIEFTLDASSVNASALPVMNQGKEYRVPYIHQGVILATDEIYYFAELTLEYYSSIFDKAKLQACKA